MLGGFPSAKRMFLRLWVPVLFLPLLGCGLEKSLDQAREKELSKQFNEVMIGVVWSFAHHNVPFREGLHLALEGSE